MRKDIDLFGKLQESLKHIGTTFGPKYSTSSMFDVNFGSTGADYKASEVDLMEKNYGVKNVDEKFDELSVGTRPQDTTSPGILKIPSLRVPKPWFPSGKPFPPVKPKPTEDQDRPQLPEDSDMPPIIPVIPQPALPLPPIIPLDPLIPGMPFSPPGRPFPRGIPKPTFPHMKPKSLEDSEKPQLFQDPSPPANSNPRLSVAPKPPFAPGITNPLMKFPQSSDHIMQCPTSEPLLTWSSMSSEDPVITVQLRQRPQVDIEHAMKKLEKLTIEKPWYDSKIEKELDRSVEQKQIFESTAEHDFDHVGVEALMANGIFKSKVAVAVSPSLESVHSDLESQTL